MADDIPYWIKRSHEEAVRSIQANHPVVAETHAELCRLYTQQVQVELKARRPAPG